MPHARQAMEGNTHEGPDLNNDGIGCLDSLRERERERERESVCVCVRVEDIEHVVMSESMSDAPLHEATHTCLGDQDVVRRCIDVDVSSGVHLHKRLCFLRTYVVWFLMKSCVPLHKCSALRVCFGALGD